LDESSRLLAEIQGGMGLGLAEVGAMFPGARGNVAINPATVYRWTVKGSKARNGERILLQSVRVGSRIVTTTAAVERFVSALSSADPNTKVDFRSPTRRWKASEKAAAELRQLGL
jgi:hypothetical protein